MPKSVIYCGAILTLSLFLASADCGAIFSPALSNAALAQGDEDKAQPKTDKLPPCLAEIARAAMVEDATLRSGILRPYVLAAQKMGDSARGDLITMLRTATPAGRVIALCLLKRIDGAHYSQYASQLRAEAGDLSVAYISASERCHYTVNDILSDLDSARPTIKVVY